MKKFIILGNLMSFVCEEIFPYIKANKLWWGVSIHSGDRKFYVPENYPLNASGCGVDENGRRYIKVKGVRWWTNVENKTHQTPMDLYKKYSNEYKKLDTFDAINVNKTADIPMDYDCVMGVPITFFDKYCPEQFEIVGIMANTKNDGKTFFGYPYIDGKKCFARLLIRKRNPLLKDRVLKTGYTVPKDYSQALM